MMNEKIKKVASRNGIEVQVRRRNLSKLISESYKTLYDCEVDSPLYKLTESLIEGIQEDPENIDSHSEDLDAIKALQEMGEEADIDDEDLEDEIVEEDDGEDYSEDEILPPEDEIQEEDESDLLPPPLQDEEDETLSDEELQELRNHLKEMRKAKIKENRKNESVTWDSEKSAMKTALKRFRESSNKKAFYRSLAKISPRLSSNKPLTLEESINLYKSTNSAMTHLAVELEHNPEFIYTFRECTSILSKDNESLLECISSRKAPSKKLTESFRKFANILLESEDYPEDEEDDEILKEEDGVNLPTEDDRDVIDDKPSTDGSLVNEGDGVNLPTEDDANAIDDQPKVNHDSILQEDDGVNLPKEDDENAIDNQPSADGSLMNEGDGVNLPTEDKADLVDNQPKGDPNSLINESDEDVCPECGKSPCECEKEETINEEDEDALDGEISDDEAEELKRYLKEMRKNKSCK